MGIASRIAYCFFDEGANRGSFVTFIDNTPVTGKAFFAKILAEAQRTQRNTNIWCARA